MLRFDVRCRRGLLSGRSAAFLLLVAGRYALYTLRGVLKELREPQPWREEIFDQELYLACEGAVSSSSLSSSDFKIKKLLACRESATLPQLCAQRKERFFEQKHPLSSAGFEVAGSVRSRAQKISQARKFCRGIATTRSMSFEFRARWWEPLLEEGGAEDLESRTTRFRRKNRFRDRVAWLTASLVHLLSRTALYAQKALNYRLDPRPTT